LSLNLSVKANAQSKGSQPTSAYYPVARQDWGVLAPGTTGAAFSAGSNLSASASGGSLATTTGAFKITFITAIGESLPSVEATVAVTGATGSVTVSLASLTLNVGAQLNAQPIIGWKIYSGSGSGNELANEAAASLSVTLSTLITQRGATLTYIPIATTSAVVKVYGAGAAPPVVNTSGIQSALPAITTNSTSDLQIKVPVPFNAEGRTTNYSRPNASADAAGISLQAVDCVAPLWAQSTAFSAGAFIVVGNILFQATTGGTTGSSFPSTLLASAQYGTVTDGSVVWTNLGRWHVLTLRFANLSGSTAQPTANEYDFWQP
jgi:hypothetical protein